MHPNPRTKKLWIFGARFLMKFVRQSLQLLDPESYHLLFIHFHWDSTGAQHGRGTIKGSNYYQVKNLPKGMNPIPLREGQSVLIQEFTQLVWPSKRATHSHGSIQTLWRWSRPPLRVTKRWMVLWSVDHVALWHVRVTKNSTLPARE